MTPVKTVLHNNRWRIVEDGKTSPLRADTKKGPKKGNPVDGGGFPNTPAGKAKAERQAGYINNPKK